jgi:hypothetical protein
MGAKLDAVKHFFKVHTWDLVAVLAVLVGSGAALIYYAVPKATNVTATIYKEKAIVKVIDLSSVTTAYTFDMDGKFTPMTIGVKHNAIAVLKSGCPNQYCVHLNYVSNVTQPIICSYNQVVISLSANAPVTSIIINGAESV